MERYEGTDSKPIETSSANRLDAREKAVQLWIRERQGLLYERTRKEIGKMKTELSTVKGERKAKRK